MTPPPLLASDAAAGAGSHRLDTGGQGVSEPVVIAHAVTTVLYLLVAAGWVVIPDRTVDAIASGVAVVLSLAGTLAARARVSPSGRITWDSVRSAIRAEVYAEIDRLASSAPALKSGAEEAVGGLAPHSTVAIPVGGVATEVHAEIDNALADARHVRTMRGAVHET